MERERERDAFWKTCSSFNVFRDVANGGSSLASFFHREGESKSRKGGGRAKCTPVLRDVTFTFYACDILRPCHFTLSVYCATYVGKVGSVETNFVVLQ